MNQSKLLRHLLEVIKSSPSGKVDTVCLHPKTHFDDETALYLLRKYTSLPGIKDAKVEYVMLAEDKRDIFWQELCQGRLFIGQGGGPFDEHRTDGTRDGNDSATLRAERFCELHHSVSTEDLVRETTYEDAKGRSRCALNLGFVLKQMHRLNGALSDVSPSQWSQIAAKAYCDFPGDKRPEARIPEREQKWLKQRLFRLYELNGEADSCIRVLRFIVHKTVDKYTKSVKPFGMAYTATLLLRIGGKKVAREWVVNGLRAELEREFAFEQALIHFRNGEDTFTVPIEKDGDVIRDAKGKPMRIAFVKFSNTEALRAAMSVKGYHAAVVVLRQETGNTQIFFNNRSYVLPGDLCGLVLKDLIFREEGRWLSPFDTAILNGSLTHPNVSPSRLSDRKIATIIIEAFHLLV